MTEQETRALLFVLSGGVILKPGPVHRTLEIVGFVQPSSRFVGGRRVRIFEVTRTGLDKLRELGYRRAVEDALAKEKDRFRRKSR